MRTDHRCAEVPVPANDYLVKGAKRKQRSTKLCLHSLKRLQPALRGREGGRAVESVEGSNHLLLPKRVSVKARRCGHHMTCRLLAWQENHLLLQDGRRGDGFAQIQNVSQYLHFNSFPPAFRWVVWRLGLSSHKKPEQAEQIKRKS